MNTKMLWPLLLFVWLLGLTFLSMLGNPCCPSELSGGTDAQYEEYRRAAIAKLPTLQFIDSKPGACVRE